MEVVRKLGAGSYAVFYHVRKVLCRSPPSEEDFYPGGRLEFDDVSVSRSLSTEYGHEYAIKLLFKADLDEEVVAQLTEVRSAPYPSSLQVTRKTSRQRFINQFLRVTAV